MKLSTKSIYKSSRRSLTTFVAAMGLAGLLSVPVLAHETFNEKSSVSNYAVSANAAKRMVRSYLNDAGYTRSHRAGGAQIKKVTLQDGYYAVQIVLRDSGAASVDRSSVFVNASTGLLTYSPKAIRNMPGTVAHEIAVVSDNAQSEIVSGR